jgi:hypothetical protein
MDSRTAVRRLIFRLQCLATSILGIGVLGSGANLAAAAEPPQLFFDTEITSMSFSGGRFLLPLGPGWSGVNTTVGATAAQDHNSSRSNKTASVISPGDPDNPDPIDPTRLHGTNYQIESFFDVFFDLTFDSPFLSPNYGGGGLLTLESDTAARLTRVPRSPYTFDKNTADFGMLSSSDNQNRALEHHGHVTVLKISMGGDEDGDGETEELTIASDGIVLTTVPGSDQYLTLPDGSIQHTFDTTLFMTASIDDSSSSVPFTMGPLFGTVIEVGRLSNAIVPEPATFALLSMGALMAVFPRRTGRN